MLEIARIGAVSEETARGMVEWHGKRAADIARMALVSAELRAPICPHTSHVIAEVVEAYRRECAVTLGDVLLRRVPVALGACWSESCSREAALRIGAVLGWNEHTMGANLENFEMERTAFLRPVGVPRHSKPPPIEHRRSLPRIYGIHTVKLKSEIKIKRVFVKIRGTVATLLSCRARVSAKPFRVVGDNSIHAPLRKAFHVGRDVHRPHQYLLARGFDLAMRSCRSQRVMRNHILDRQLMPAAELDPRLADQAERNARVHGMDGLQHFGEKRRNHEAASRGMLPQQIRRDRLQARDFQFDIEEGGALVASQDFAQQGQGQLLRRGLEQSQVRGFSHRDRRLLARRAVSRTSNSKPSQPWSEREIERGQRVLGNGFSARAPR